MRGLILRRSTLRGNLRKLQNDIGDHARLHRREAVSKVQLAFWDLLHRSLEAHKPDRAHHPADLLRVHRDRPSDMAGKARQPLGVSPAMLGGEMDDPLSQDGGSHAHTRNGLLRLAEDPHLLKTTPSI